MRTIIRYEVDGEDLIAVCEDDDGNRWYEVIVRNGEVTF
jgi:hypothetical protein